jgi:hypothetical protein
VAKISDIIGKKEATSCNSHWQSAVIGKQAASSIIQKLFGSFYLTFLYFIHDFLGGGHHQLHF